jgi:hypothetical protein
MPSILSFWFYILHMVCMRYAPPVTKKDMCVCWSSPCIFPFLALGRRTPASAATPTPAPSPHIGEAHPRHSPTGACCTQARLARTTPHASLLPAPLHACYAAPLHARRPSSRLRQVAHIATCTTPHLLLKYPNETIATYIQNMRLKHMKNT